MKLNKTLIIIASLFGAYKIVRKYHKKIQSADAKPTEIIARKTNKYLHLTQAQVREEFRKRIASGEWLSPDEYTEMMDAMRDK